MSGTRVTRMVKSYAPIVNGLTELLEIDKPEKTPLKVYCSVTKELYNADEFYVKKHYQNVDPRILNQNSFRHITKEIWDQRVRNQRDGFGWVSDYERNNPPATLEVFFEQENENA